MTHYQINLECGYCKKLLVADVVSYGTSHTNVVAITCRQCALENGGRLLRKDEVEIVDDTIKRS